MAKKKTPCNQTCSAKKTVSLPEITLAGQIEELRGRVEKLEQARQEPLVASFLGLLRRRK